jgi:hypothetical protein
VKKQGLLGMRKKLLWVMATFIVLMYSGMGDRAFALEAGGYLVTNTTYYVNPDTGAADDGGDTSIGEGMCRNTVYSDSFYEFKDGRHYVTIRLKLISFIKNITFQVQQVRGGGNSYREVSYTVTGENKEENTKDFRLELPTADALIKPSFFVGPMNRDVTFFMRINPNTAQKDDGAFAAFNKISAKDSQEPASNTGAGNDASPSDNTQQLPPAGQVEKAAGGEARVNGGTTASGNKVPAVVPAGGGEPADGNKPVSENKPEGAPEQKAAEVTGISEFPAPSKTGAVENAAAASGPVRGQAVAAGAVVIAFCLAAGGFWLWKKKRLSS